MDETQVKIDHETVRKVFEIGQRRVKPKHFDNVIKRAEEILEKFKKVPILGNYLHHVPTMIGILKDYVQKRYTDVPYSSLIAIAFALIYLLSPIDLIPDVIPGVGYIDDAAVIAFCLELVIGDLDKYKQWRDEQQN